MKRLGYIAIGAVLGATAIMSFAFNEVDNDRDEGVITLRKKLEASDPSCLQMYYYIEQYADSFDIPEEYAYGIAHMETGYDGPFDWTYSHKQTSKAGAVGPMQIMPTTAKMVNGEKVPTNKLKSDVQYNVRTSMKLLRQLYDKYNDWKLVFGCYNTGRPVVNKYALRVFTYRPQWKLQKPNE